MKLTNPQDVLLLVGIIFHHTDHLDRAIGGRDSAIVDRAPAVPKVNAGTRGTEHRQPGSIVLKATATLLLANGYVGWAVATRTEHAIERFDQWLFLSNPSKWHPLVLRRTSGRTHMQHRS